MCIIELRQNRIVMNCDKFKGHKSLLFLLIRSCVLIFYKSFYIIALYYVNQYGAIRCLNRELWRFDLHNIILVLENYSISKISQSGKEITSSYILNPGDKRWMKHYLFHNLHIKLTVRNLDSLFIESLLYGFHAVKIYIPVICVFAPYAKNVVKGA